MKWYLYSIFVWVRRDDYSFEIVEKLRKNCFVNDKMICFTLVVVSTFPSYLSFSINFYIMLSGVFRNESKFECPLVNF